VARLGSRERVGVDHGTGRIGDPAIATIDPVRIGGQRRHPRKAVERAGEGQRILLAAPAASCPIANGHFEFAPADDGKSPALGTRPACKCRVGRRDIARLTRDLVTQILDRVAARPG
jgi:hypothetical protein